MIPLQEYLRAVDASTSRTRWLTIVLAIASVLCFAAAWNSGKDSWLVNRRLLVHYARELLHADGARADSLLRSENGVYCNAKKYLASNHFKRGRDVLSVPVILSLPMRSAGSDSSVIAKGSGTLAIDMDAVAFENLAAELERAYVQSLVVLDVPFLGIVFDINDLGVLAGISFMIILLMKSLSTGRELRNLRRVFKIGWNDLQQVYDLICMGLVWTVPKKWHEETTEARDIWHTNIYRAIAMLPDLAPPLLLLWVYRTNLLTADVGAMTSLTATVVSQVLSGALLVVVSALTVVCISVEVRTYRLLDVVAGPDVKRKERYLG